MILDRKKTALILMDLGYEVNAGWKFKIRKDERTPSASINSNGKIKDFGTGWYGDIVDFLEKFCSYSKREAFLFVGNYENVNRTLHTSGWSYTKRQEPNKPELITQDEIESYKAQRKEHFSRYWQLLSLTLPTATSEQKKALAMEFEIGYCAKLDRLMMPIRQMNGDCYTLWKYNPIPKTVIDNNGNTKTLPKVLFSPNVSKPPFNIQKTLNRANNGESIFITEGEKDCLNALSKGFNAFSVGSASARLKDEYLQYFNDKNVVIIYDYDQSGQDGAIALSNTLKNAGAKVQIFDWNIVIKQFGFELSNGFDFTDLLVQNEKRKEKERKKVVEYGI